MIEIVYVTSSPFKRDENAAFLRVATLDDGRPVNDVFEFKIQRVPIKEVLEVDLTAMVMAEVAEAYALLRIPCIVEHAGLVFDDYASVPYPGGLTKPMWDGLKTRFIEETHSAGRRAYARAAIGYCDGMTVRTFTGETPGVIADTPRGDWTFYWDTIFVPDIDGAPGAMTYAELVGEHGLEYKMAGLSQSARAMKAFLEYRLHATPELWS